MELVANAELALGWCDSRSFLFPLLFSLSLADPHLQAENTILSFNNAARNQLPFIEFDVQLTSDNVPVIWHDFHINDDNGLPLQIGDLTLKQFRNFRKHEQHHHHHHHHHHRHHHSHRQKGEHHLRAKEKVSAGADLAHVPNGVPSSAPRSA